jgi:diguanylate cyclase (GGDEF)-like protein
VDASTVVSLVVVLVALVGALAGTAGYAILVVRRQNNRLVSLLGHLASAQDEASLVGIDAGRIGDDRLRESIETLAGRVALTWVQATVDPLTGIANRQAILHLVDEEIVRAARYERSLSVILADLDHFKRLNDAHGHEAGDIVLRHVGAILAGCVRTVDTAGRYGGEEFLVILPSTDEAGASILAERIRQAVESRRLPLCDDPDARVTVSIGVRELRAVDTGFESVVTGADEALYRAKAGGRNRVVRAGNA